ncbi:hypothetical protein CEXT_341961, partial [Caerostris extrusa]
PLGHDSLANIGAVVIAFELTSDFDWLMVALFTTLMQITSLAEHRVLLPQKNKRLWRHAAVPYSESSNNLKLPLQIYVKHCNREPSISYYHSTFGDKAFKYNKPCSWPNKIDTQDIEGKLDHQLLQTEESKDTAILASPLSLALKKSDDWRPGWGDYRDLNIVTIPDCYNLPFLTDCGSITHGKTIYSSIDWFELINKFQGFQ